MHSLCLEFMGNINWVLEKAEISKESIDGNELMILGMFLIDNGYWTKYGQSIETRNQIDIFRDVMESYIKNYIRSKISNEALNNINQFIDEFKRLSNQRYQEYAIAFMDDLNMRPTIFQASIIFSKYCFLEHLSDDKLKLF